MWGGQLKILIKQKFFSAGVISTVVPDSPHKIFIGGLPNYLNEDQVSLWRNNSYIFNINILIIHDNTMLLQ